MVGDRSAAQCKLGQEQPSLGDLLRQLRVAARVDDVDARAEHRNGRSCAYEPTAVRGCVDADCHARNDGEAGIAQRLRESLGIALALRAGVAAAYDGEARTLQEFGAAHVIRGSDYPYNMGTFECARQVKALSCGEMDKLTMLNGLVQKLLAGVK